jgi:hypothetical protein
LLWTIGGKPAGLWEKDAGLWGKGLNTLKLPSYFFFSKRLSYIPKAPIKLLVNPGDIDFMVAGVIEIV